jgi:[ribosomal protein S18]-alanine N-acetyltransferase
VLRARRPLRLTASDGRPLVVIDGAPMSEPVGPVHVRALEPSDAAVIATWHYDGPWSLYDVTDVRDISHDKGYRAIAGDDGRLLGFVCIGAEARVAAVGAAVGVVDVGVGLAPELVGRGYGRTILQPVLAQVLEDAAGAPLRALIQSWNERSLRLCRSLGFEPVGIHHAPEKDGTTTEYVVLVLAATSRR